MGITEGPWRYSSHRKPIPSAETMVWRIDEEVEMTFYWPAADRWEGTNFVICVE